MRNDEETEGDGHCGESAVSRYMEAAEEIQGCGLEHGAFGVAGEEQV